eukprot:scaffold5.g691.t1
MADVHPGNIDAGRPTVKEPPRPSGARADVTIKADRSDKAHVDITTGEKATKSSGGWPRDADEWKRWLARVAPWVIGAAIVAAAAGTAYKNRQASRCEGEEEGVTDAARRKARGAADRVREAGQEAREGTRRGWFGLKGRAEEAADEAGGAWEDTKSAAARKGKEAKEGAKGAIGRAEEAARDVGAAASHKAHDAKESAKGVAHSAAEGYHRAADTVGAAASKAEHAAAKAGAKVVEKGGVAEEKTGRALKEAGQTLERDGRQTKQWARGEEVKEEAKKRCTIM